jgi:glycosyltransferase involved in cell wall biosynthesis
LSSVIPVTVIVLTHNEEANLPVCLASLRGWVQRIVVLDSGSTDRTREIAHEHGAEVMTHAFQSHVQQWAWALKHVAGDADWVLGLDADQSVSPELRASMTQLFTGDHIADYQGFYLNRRQVFRGRWIRWGGYYPKYLLKLFRPKAVRLDPGDLMDHHFHVMGSTQRLRGDLVEHNRKEDVISFWLQKHVRYAELLAREEQQRDSGHMGVLVPALTGSPDQRVAWLKQRWYRLPRYWRPTLYFIYRYFIRLGFLDGKEGFVFHALHAFWLRLIVDVNLDELERVAPDAHPRN